MIHIIYHSILVMVVTFCPPAFEAFWRGLSRGRTASLVGIRRTRMHMRRRSQAVQDIFPGTFRCSICMEDKKTSAAVRFSPCLHPFCKECARGYVSSKLEGRELPVLCPVCVTEAERPARKIGGKHSPTARYTYPLRILCAHSF